MPRGQKECPKCGAGVGPRTKICKCGFAWSYDTKISEEYISPGYKFCISCNEKYASSDAEENLFGEVIYTYKYGNFCSRECIIDTYHKKEEILISLIDQIRVSKDEILKKFLTEEIEKHEDIINDMYESAEETFPKIRIHTPIKKSISLEEATELGLRLPHKINEVKEKQNQEYDEGNELLDILSGKKEFVEEKEEEEEISNEIMNLFAASNEAKEPKEIKSVEYDNESRPGRGQKKCKNCGKVIGARSKKCIYCEYNYE